MCLNRNKNMKKRTKIIATIGPSSNTEKKIRDLINAGMNIARLNFSHGNHISHGELIKKIRKVAKEMNTHVGIMLDTKGPEIRLYDFADGSVLFEKGDIFKIYPKNIVGTKDSFGLTYQNLVNEINVRDIIKIDDGEFVCRVIEINKEEQSITCKAINTHLVKSRKGVNIPNIHLNFDYISPADYQDIVFGCNQEVDFISASFVRCKEDVEALKQLVHANTKFEIPIIAKVENREGIKKIDEIIEAADGIMVARGDMGVEIDVSLVPFIQSEIIAKCRKLGKPVIVATQMLNSMQENLVPTRAEVSDVTQAIMQGCDCVMLSGESASGKYPVESVKMQTRIAKTSEKHLNYRDLAMEAFLTSDSSRNDAMMNSIASSAFLTKAKLIVCFNCDGIGATRLAKARSHTPILVITDSVHVARRLSIVWGVMAQVEKTINIRKIKLIELDSLAQRYAKENGARVGDQIIVCASVDEDDSDLDVLRIIEVA